MKKIKVFLSFLLIFNLFLILSCGNNTEQKENDVKQETLKTFVNNKALNLSEENDLGEVCIVMENTSNYPAILQAGMANEGT